MRLFTQLITTGLATAVALAGVASTASAQTICDADVILNNSLANVPANDPAGCDQTWGDDPNEAFIVINGLLFADDMRLTILPGTVVRGNTRSEPFNGLTPFVGAPGTMIVTRQGFLDARGTPGAPIVFTTAAVDNNNDGVPDDVIAPFGADARDDWQPGDLFLDDTPLTNPLSTLLSNGEQATLLQGGLVLLGNAPTNLDDTATGVEGEGDCEGIPNPAPLPDAPIFGGQQPHDATAILEYVSVRHAGDEIAPNNELNGITFCGIGDGTVVSHVEAYANGDDGFEMFGGTVNLRNVIVAYTGDDAIDVDQGYVGSLQDVLTLQIFYNENDGDDVGTGGSGNAASEFDGQDCPECVIGGDGGVVPNPAMVASNWSVFGNVEGALNAGITNPATSPNADNIGIQADSEWDGIIANTLCAGHGAAGPNCFSHNGSGRNTGYVTSVTFDGPVADPSGFLARGDALVVAGTEFIGGKANATSTAFTLVNENHYFLPTGVAVAGRGKLVGAKTTDAGAIGGPPMNPRPAAPADPLLSGGVEPMWTEMDRSETYIGAFPDSPEALWSSPWSAMHIGEIVR